MPRRLPLLTRRQFSELAMAVGALGAVGCELDPLATPSPAQPRFFTDDERSAFAALADVVLPPDDAFPGGAEVGAVAFVETLLAAFDADPPRIWAGGPFSGRQPLPDDHGVASSSFPNDGFADFVPLDRFARAAWRLELYGSAGVAGGAPNEALLGPVVGLRDRIRDGLAKATATAGKPISELDTGARDALWKKLDPDFQQALAELVVQAALAAPEYGGNRDLAGWKLARFEGDMQPLGYSDYDEAAGKYRERPDAPVSTIGSDAGTDPLDDQTRSVLKLITAGLGGRVKT